MATILTGNSMEEEIINPKDVHPVEGDIIKLMQETNLGNNSESTDITTFGEDMFLIKPDHFYYVLYKDNRTCWKKTYLKDGFPWYCLELINTDSVEVKGSARMNTFLPRVPYSVFFWIQMKEDAKFDTPCRFTLVIADGPKETVKPSTLKLRYLPPNKMMRVKLGEFTRTSTITKEEVRFSLTNFDPNWKSGMILAGVFIGPSSARSKPSPYPGRLPQSGHDHPPHHPGPFPDPHSRGPPGPF